MATIEAHALNATLHNGGFNEIDNHIHQGDGEIFSTMIADENTFARLMRWSDGAFEVQVYRDGAVLLDWHSRKE